MKLIKILRFIKQRECTTITIFLHIILIESISKDELNKITANKNINSGTEIKERSKSKILNFYSTTEITSYYNLWQNFDHTFDQFQGKVIEVMRLS